MTSEATIEDREVIYTDKQRVSCDGGGGALGHPLVWYTLKDGVAICGYCDRKFVFRSAQPTKDQTRQTGLS